MTEADIGMTEHRSKNTLGRSVPVKTKTDVEEGGTSEDGSPRPVCNTNLSGDRYAYYKVRPILEELTETFKQADVAEDIIIDETMIPYFGKHGTKQFIREKPIRLSFNLWFLGYTRIT